MPPGRPATKMRQFAEPRTNEVLGLQQLDRGMMDELLLIVTNLGYTADINGEEVLVPVDDCIYFLEDMQRLVLLISFRLFFKT